jgi:hypothetical protein
MTDKSSLMFRSAVNLDELVDLIVDGIVPEMPNGARFHLVQSANAPNYTRPDSENSRF